MSDDRLIALAEATMRINRAEASQGRRWGYRQAYDALLRGDLAGVRGARGWMVTEASVNALIARRALEAEQAAAGAFA